MIRAISSLAFAAALLLASATSASAETGFGVVYVASQGLCYGTVVTPNSLPNEGPFQPIVPSTICGPGTFMTTLGPGDVGYTGGRWVTLDGTRFSCPLIGPGYAPPSQ